MSNPKKYRLLKRLPDAEKGDIYYYNGNSEYLHMTKPNSKSWHKNTVESHPEFFEEITDTSVRIGVVSIEYTGHSFEFTTTKSFNHEKAFPAIKKAIEEALNPPASTPAPEDKGWEIEAYSNFKYLGGDNNKTFGGIRERREDGRFYFTTGVNISSCSEDELRGWEIHSVRRLSDNEVFSVGDECSYDSKEWWTISGFDIYDGKIGVLADVVLNSGTIDKSWRKCFLNSAIKKLPPKPLPVKLFNWVVFTKEGFGFDTWDKKDWRGDAGNNWDDSVKMFVTASEADEYILLNKPCLSVKEVFEIADTTVTGVEFEENLKHVAQSKQ